MKDNSKQYINFPLAPLLLLLACVLAAVVAAAACACSAGGLGGAGSNATGGSGSQNSAGSAPKYKNAIYIYMCGSTLETKSGAASKNIDAILSANVPEDTAIIIETGGARKWRGHDISSDSITRYVVTRGAGAAAGSQAAGSGVTAVTAAGADVSVAATSSSGTTAQNSLVEVGRTENENMGSAQTLVSFLNFCSENYSAENTTLLFWNHGAGATRGVCLDENYSMDGLTAAEINEALDAENAHFNTVCFDACLMANYEMARVLQHHANTFIASEEIESAAGWDYKTIIEAAGTENFASSVLCAYCAQNEAAGKRLWTLSATDLTQFAQVESAFDAFCTDKLASRAEAGQLQEVTQAATDAMGFGEQNAKSNMVDMAQFAGALGGSALASAIGACVQTVNGEDRAGAGGLSIFFPLSGSANLKEYLQGETNESYSLFLGSNYSGLNAGGGASGAGGAAETIKFLDEGSISGAGADSQGGAGNNGGSGTEGGEGAAGATFTFKISQASVKNVQNVVFDVYQLNEGAPATCLGFIDASSTASGEYTFNFNGCWVALNGCALSCEPIDTVGATTVYSAEVAVGGTRGSLRFTHNSKSGEYSLQGFVADEEGGAQGRLENIDAGDEISILRERFIEKGSLDTEFVPAATITAGSAEDASDTGDSGSTVGSGDATGALEITSTTLPDGRYQAYGIVTDIYGTEHTTRTFTFNLAGGKVTSAEVSTATAE